MYKNLEKIMRYENWRIIGYYTYRSAKLNNVIAQLPINININLGNHIILHIKDSLQNEFYVSCSDNNYKIGLSVVEEHW